MTQTNLPELSVSELSFSLKRTVEEAYGYVRLRGEISGYRGPVASGHVYFALKDETARIDAVIWKGVFSRLKLKPQDGLEVIVTGKVTTFPGKSSYQIVIETLEPAGIGALMALLEERRKALAAEGLFAAERKKLLPFLPEVIGVVTSPTGAVIRDILHRLADRFPRHVVVWPVRVQGETSAAEVAAAISGFNALEQHSPVPRPDVIIVARGGGSIEDLWSFNEEAVVRAAAASTIPLVSAVGHETDTTLLDFVADVRAPTPTGAAEMVVPVRADLTAKVVMLGQRHHAGWHKGLDTHRLAVRSAARALPALPSIMAPPRQKLDYLGERLPRALRHLVAYRQASLAAGLARLTPRLLEVRITSVKERLEALAARHQAALGTLRRSEMSRIAAQRERVTSLAGRSHQAIRILIQHRQAKLEASHALVQALGYHGVLERGFVLVRDVSGHMVRRASELHAGQEISLEFADGRKTARVSGGSGRPSGRSLPPQQDLFS